MSMENEMEDERITAYVTTYALTSGIQVVDAKVRHGISSEIIRYGSGIAHGKDWHRTPDAALERAEEMRNAKIKSLHKSIAKLERMKFTIPKV